MASQDSTDDPAQLSVFESLRALAEEVERVEHLVWVLSEALGRPKT